MKTRSKKDIETTANNNRVENIKDFVYLGSKINGDSTIDVQYRITKALANFAKLRNIWKSSNIKTQTKIRIFKTNIIGVFLYGSKSRKLTNTIKQKLYTFQSRCFLMIFKIFWPIMFSNEEM